MGGIGGEGEQKRVTFRLRERKAKRNKGNIDGFSWDKDAKGGMITKEDNSRTRKIRTCVLAFAFSRFIFLMCGQNHRRSTSLLYVIARTFGVLVLKHFCERGLMAGIH